MSIHPTAVIDPKAEIDPSVEIGPYVVIDSAVKVIKRGTRVIRSFDLKGVIKSQPSREHIDLRVSLTTAPFNNRVRTQIYFPTAHKSGRTYE